MSALAAPAATAAHKKKPPGETVQAHHRLCLVLGGIGSQWTGMGRALLATSPVFRDTLVRLSGHLASVESPESPLARLVDLFAEGTAWNNRRFSGIGICAYQIGIVNILRAAPAPQCTTAPAAGNSTATASAATTSGGLLRQADFFVGHSLGETAAGYACGLQSERETILIQWVRARCLAKLRRGWHVLRTRRAHGQLPPAVPGPSRDGFYHYYIEDADEYVKFMLATGEPRLEDDVLFDLEGGMSVVGLPKDQIEAGIVQLGLHHHVCVACENSPSGQTVSGPVAKLARLRAHLQATVRADIFWRDVDTDAVSYHAPVFDCFYEWLVAEFERLGVGRGNGNCLTANLKGNSGGGGGGGGRAGEPSGEWSGSIGSGGTVNHSGGGSGGGRGGNLPGGPPALLDAGWISTSCADPSLAVLDAHYHARNVVSPVRFVQAIRTLPPHTLVMEIGSSRSLMGQVKRTRTDPGDSVAAAGLVAVGHPEDESVYADADALRNAFFAAGYVGAFGTNPVLDAALNAPVPSRRAATLALLRATVLGLRGAFAAYPGPVKAEDVCRALAMCARAAKPRAKLVLQNLQRAFVCCVRSRRGGSDGGTAAGALEMLAPLATLAKRDDVEHAAVAGGLLLLLGADPLVTGEP